MICSGFHSSTCLPVLTLCPSFASSAAASTTRRSAPAPRYPVASKKSNSTLRKRLLRDSGTNDVDPRTQELTSDSEIWMAEGNTQRCGLLFHAANRKQHRNSMPQAQRRSFILQLKTLAATITRRRTSESSLATTAGKRLPSN